MIADALTSSSQTLLLYENKPELALLAEKLTVAMFTCLNLTLTCPQILPFSFEDHPFITDTLHALEIRGNLTVYKLRNNQANTSTATKTSSQCTCSLSCAEEAVLARNEDPHEELTVLLPV